MFFRSFSKLFKKNCGKRYNIPKLHFFWIFCTILWSESFGPKSLYKISIVVLLLFSQKIIRSASVVWILDGAFTKHFVYYDISLFGRKFKLFSSFITFFTVKSILSLIIHIILTRLMFFMFWLGRQHRRFLQCLRSLLTFLLTTYLLS